MTNKQQWEKTIDEIGCLKDKPMARMLLGNLIRRIRQETLEDAEIAHLKELEIQLKEQKQDLYKELNKIEIPYGCLQVKEQLEKFKQLLK